MLHFRVRRAKIKWVMQMDNEMPKRKPIRLKEYDYSQPGAYFLTICTQSRRCVLSRIVGDGVLDVPEIELSQYGKIADKYIRQMNDLRRF